MPRGYGGWADPGDFYRREWRSEAAVVRFNYHEEEAYSWTILADTILSGAEPIYVPLQPPEFHFDPEVLEDAFRQGAKALVLCNPSNPCGKVFSRVKKVHDFLTVGAAAPLMEAAVTGLEMPDAYYKELQNHYTHMRDLFVVQV